MSQVRARIAFKSAVLGLMAGVAFAGMLQKPAFAAESGAQSASAPSPEEQKFERILTQVLANTKTGPTLKEEYFDSILNIYYKMMALQEDFYQTNLATIEKQKSDAAYEMPINKIPSYIQLRASWPLSDELEHKILYVYTRLNEIAHDSKSAQQGVALDQLNEIHGWIEGRDEADRVLLASLIDSLAEIKHKFDTASHSVNGNRSTASVEKFDFSKYNFGGAGDLSSYFEKYDGKLKERAKAAMHTKNTEFDEAVASAKVVDDGREPASATFFKPSTGPDGTFAGFSIPAGQFVQTFDDGPNPTITGKLIDIATSYKDSANPNGVPLTFFWLVKNALLNPKQIARAKSLNFLANNHSWTHPIFHQLTPDQLHHEIADADPVLVKLFGVQPVIGTDKIPFFRCPFGDCIYANHNTGVPVARQLIAAQNEIHILWNIDSNDWAAINRMNPQRTAQLTITQMKAQKRGVILNHDIQPHTPDAFNIVLAWVKSQNETAHANIRYISAKQAVDQANAAAVKH